LMSIFSGATAISLSPLANSLSDTCLLWQVKPTEAR
jgi:hypothetical protein